MKTSDLTVKIKKFSRTYQTEICIFAVLCINFLLFFTKAPDDIMGDVLYPLHLADIKAGLLSRTFVGTIAGLLWEQPTKNDVTFLHISTNVLTYFLTAVFAGKCIKKAEPDIKVPLSVAVMITAVLPYGFRTFINLFELLDIYWVLSAVLCLLVFDGKKSAFFIPLFMFTGLWVHFSFVLAFMPLIYIICFYKLIKEKDKTALALTAVTVVTSVAFTLYFILTSRTYNIISFSEYQRYIIEKAGDTITNMEQYFGRSFRPTEDMNRIYDIADVPDGTPLLIKLLIGYFKAALEDTTLPRIISDLILASPLYAFFIYIWVRVFKTETDKQKKFIYFLCTISPLVHIFACFTSSDTSRWLSLGIISNIFLLLYFSKENDKPVTSAFSLICDKLKAHKAPVIFALCFYLQMVFTW